MFDHLFPDSASSLFCFCFCFLLLLLFLLFFEVEIISRTLIPLFLCQN